MGVDCGYGVASDLWAGIGSSTGVGVSAPPFPTGYQAPAPAGLRAALRTGAALGIAAPPLLFGLWRARFRAEPESLMTVGGLRSIGDQFEQVLGLLGVEVSTPETGAGAASGVPREGGLIFMWKQESHLDHLLLPPVMPRPFFCLFNNAVMSKPLYGPYLRRAGHVHVDRRDESQWRPAVAGAAARVAAGECVLVSPEGTRSWDVRPLPMKRGAFLLAIASQRPIVCVVLRGAHQCLPRGGRAVRPGRVEVVFSDPIPTEGHDADDRAALKAMVSETFSRLRGPAPK
jgi:1-acyl-sn-glycerol-3-phosphate acyltransferase